jgi:nitrite reductase/ring-hydroxylating ferredoxin subunit
MRVACGLGGAREPRLYEAVVEGESYVLWDVGGGRLRAVSARCPHRPHRPVLRGCGVLDGGRLVCTVHGNAYSTASGECVASPGLDAPGALTLLDGWREGDIAVLGLPC